MMATMVLTGCVTTWRTQQVAPAQLLATTGESEVRVTLTGGVKVVLRDPGVEGDSLIGWLQPTRDDAVPVRRAVALADIQGLAVKKNNVGANLIVGIVAGSVAFFATVAAAYLIICADQGCD